MQFESSSISSANCHSNDKTDYTMYLPGMGRIPSKPILTIRGTKNTKSDTRSYSLLDDFKDHGNSSVLVYKKPKVVEEKYTPIKPRFPIVDVSKSKVHEIMTNKDFANDASESSHSSPVAQDDIEPKTTTTTTTSNSLIISTSLPKLIHYRTCPGGPINFFVASVPNDTTNAAATTIQRMVRGKCARTKLYVRRLEQRIAAINKQHDIELQNIQKEKEQQKVMVRRKVTQKQASFVKKQLDTSKTAIESTQIINYLRKENKKLREKNEKIAASIVAIQQHNEQLEGLTTDTAENKTILGTHYEKIQQTNAVLQTVIPQYEKKVEELQEAIDLGNQYYDMEHSIKNMYAKLVSNMVMLMEQYSEDPELIKEIQQFASELPEEIITTTTKDDDTVACAGNNNDEYDEVSVMDDEIDDTENYPKEEEDADRDDSDSNNYDDYTIASMD